MIKSSSAAEIVVNACEKTEHPLHTPVGDIRRHGNQQSTHAIIKSISVPHPSVFSQAPLVCSGIEKASVAVI